MSIKVVDLQNEEAKELPALEPIEEEPKPVETPEVVNEVVEEKNEEPTKEPKEEEIKPKPKPLSQSESAEVQRPLPKAKPKASDIVQCPDCSRSMTYKKLRYSHKCSPEPPPIKKQAKPKAKTKPKATPKPPPEVYYSESEEEEQPTQPLIKKKQQTVPVQPINPVDAMAQHYMILQQQMIQQKQERYNKICSNMFAPRPKKR
jgi:hypothetical protein